MEAEAPSPQQPCANRGTVTTGRTSNECVAPTPLFNSPIEARPNDGSPMRLSSSEPSGQTSGRRIQEWRGSMQPHGTGDRGH